MTVDIKKMDGSEVEITGEISAADFESFRKEIMDEFRSDIEVPGFRKGHAPDNIIIEKVGSEKILYEMAEHALSHYYPEILKENKIDAIGRPEITITKIAEGNPLGFKIKTSVMPEIKLPDYKKIAKKENEKPGESTDATDKEVEEVITEIRKNRAHHAMHEKGGEHDHDAYAKGEVPEADLPEVNDEFAKSLGNFESVADLKEKIRENVSKDKERQNIEKKRLSIMEGIIKETKLEIPAAITEGELNKMEQDMRGQMESMGLKFEDYLSHIKKSIEELRKEWEPEAIKRAKFGMILAEIAKQEKLEAPADELEHEMKHIIEQYKDADPERVRAYVENMLKNEETFKFLEKVK